MGWIVYDELSSQPQITRDFIVSSNHVYAFLFLSTIGFLTYKNSSNKLQLSIYLITLSILLEICHLFIPKRYFELSDLFGNLTGVVIILIITLFLKKYENLKN
tara:strand:- start:280 stop:588 length:309 start_codon:yes stop_codon:yes gene_type:complete